MTVCFQLTRVVIVIKNKHMIVKSLTKHKYANLRIVSLTVKHESFALFMLFFYDEQTRKMNLE